MTLRRTTESRPPGSFRYALVTAGAISGQISAGIVLSGLSMFTDSIRDDLWPNHEVSRAHVQTFFTVLLVVAIATMPMAGRLIGRWGGRRLLFIGGSVGALGLAGLSLAQGMFGLYLFGAVTGAGFGLSVNFVPIVLVNNWFDRRKSMVMGLVLAGTGLGGILSSIVFSNTTPPVAAGGLGWRTSMLIAAGLFAAFAIVPAAFLVVNDPADVGLPAYGNTMRTANPGTQDPDPGVAGHRIPGVQLTQALRSGWFWLLYLMVALLGVYYAMGQITQPFFVNQQTDPGSGMTPALVGMLMSIQMIGLILAKPTLGVMIESVGMIRAMGIFMVIHAVAGYLLGTIRYPAPGYIVVVIGLVGAGFAIGSLTPPLVCAMAFGQRDYAAIYGVLGTGYMLGLAFGSVIWSALGTIGADPGQPWQLYRTAMKWSWVLAVVVLIGYQASMRGGQVLQARTHPRPERSPLP